MSKQGDRRYPAGSTVGSFFFSCDFFSRDRDHFVTLIFTPFRLRWIMSRSNNLPLPIRTIAGWRRAVPTVVIVLGFLAEMSGPDSGRVCVAADNPPGQSDQIEKKLVDLRKAAKSAASPERTRSLISEAFPLIDEALAADEYAGAKIGALAGAWFGPPGLAIGVQQGGLPVPLAALS